MNTCSLDLELLFCASRVHGVIQTYKYSSLSREVKSYFLFVFACTNIQKELLLSLRQISVQILDINDLTLLHSERPKLYAILAFLSAIGLNF